MGPTRVAALGPRAWVAILGALALLVRLPFILQSHRARPGTDDEIFLDLSDRLLQERVYGDDYYTPGYPAFQAVVRAVPGRAEDAIVVAQHLIGVALVVGIVLVGWGWFGRAAGIIAGLLAAIAPTLVVHEHTMLHDFLFGTLAFAAAVALGTALRRDPPSTALLVGAGVLMGVAAYVKPVGQFLVLAAPLTALLSGRGARAAVRPVAWVTLALAVTTAPWVVRNAVDRDVLGMSRQSGQVLFARVFEFDKLPIPTDHEHSAFAYDVQERVEGTDLRIHKYFVDWLVAERGVPWEDAIEAQREMAFTAIRRDPLTYMEGTWREVRQGVGDLDEFERARELEEDLDQRGPGVVAGAIRVTWDVARALVDVWWLLSLHVAAGLLLLVTGSREWRIAAAALLGVGLSILVGTALAYGNDWRYSVQVAPIAWLLGSAGLVLIVGAVADRLRGQEPAAPGALSSRRVEGRR